METSFIFAYDSLQGLVLRLPMRDGNGLVSRAPEHEIFVLRLPMRDGNHFYGAGEGFALPFLDYL